MDHWPYWLHNLIYMLTIFFNVLYSMLQFYVTSLVFWLGLLLEQSVFFPGLCCIALVPFCDNGFKDVEYIHPVTGQVVGIYKRIWINTLPFTICIIDCFFFFFGSTSMVLHNLKMQNYTPCTLGMDTVGYFYGTTNSTCSVSVPWWIMNEN